MHLFQQTPKQILVKKSVLIYMNQESSTYISNRLLQSCIRVFRSGATTCDQGEEECCAVAEHQRNVYSFILPANQDHILAHSAVEKDALIQAG